MIHDGPKETLPVHKMVVAAACSGVAVSTVLTPVELIKCRMQAGALHGALPYTSTLNCLQRTVADEGLVTGLFKGHTSTLVREIPGNIAW